jgi:hypothetical protein
MVDDGGGRISLGAVAFILLRALKSSFDRQRERAGLWATLYTSLFNYQRPRSAPQKNVTPNLGEAIT